MEEEGAISKEGDVNGKDGEDVKDVEDLVGTTVD